MSTELIAIDELLSDRQKELRKQHGLPSEFALACYEAVPAFISMDEAGDAIQKYQSEWDAASKRTRKPV